MLKISNILPLQARLTVAFILTSLIAIGLVAVSVQYYIVLQFDTYLLDELRTNFEADVTEYYGEHGTLEGIAMSLPGSNLRPPRANTNASSAGSTGNPNPNMSAPPPQQQASAQSAMPPAAPARFALIDTSGIVVLGFEELRVGESVAADVLEEGEAVVFEDEVIGTIITTSNSLQRDTAQDQYIQRINQSLTVAAIGAVIVSVLLSLWFARSLTKPVRELTGAVQRVAAGDFSQSVEVRSKDELGVLATAFNQMSADLDRAHQLRRQMTADIAHDLRTPLTVLSGYLESMRDGVLTGNPERYDMLYLEAQGLQGLVEDLRLLSLADAGELKLRKETSDPKVLLENAVDVFADQARQSEIELKIETASILPPVSVDQERIGRVLRNLISNALRYTPGGGFVALKATADLSTLYIEVQDNGTGIEPDKLPNIFERFYRVDEPRSETGESGLGLSIVKSIVEAHGGDVRVESMVNEGTTFTISLPVQPV